MRAWETARSSHESREKGLKHEFSRGKDMGFVINAFAVTLINSASSSPEIEFSYINLFESKKQSFFTNYGFFSHNKRYIYVLEMSRNERIIIQDIDIDKLEIAKKFVFSSRSTSIDQSSCIID